MDILVGFAVKVELLFFYIIGFFFLLARGYLVRDAVPVAIVFVTALYSFTIQVCFLINTPTALFFIEAFFLIAGLGYFFINSKATTVRLACLGRSVKGQSLTIWLFYLALFYLAVLAFFIPEGNYDSMRYNIPRVSMFMQEKSLLLEKFTELHQVIFPVGIDVLFYSVLRFGTDYGLAISNWFAYIAIISSAYSTARYYSTKEVSITVMLIVASVPLLVFQATGTKPDIWCAAIASTLILILTRLYRQISDFDIALMLVLLAFGVSAKFTFLAFAIPFGLISFLMIRFINHPKSLEKPQVNSVGWIVVFVIALVLSQFWLLIFNYYQWNSVWGPNFFTARHQHFDGVLGALANMIRYLFQSIHLLSIGTLIRPPIGSVISPPVLGRY